MDYKEMMEKYASNGGDEKKMWAAVAVTSKAMDLVKETHPEKYECYMRELSEILNGKHYTEELAKHDVAMMHSTDANGNKHSGAHWSSDEIESAVSGLTFPKGTTPWDRYVAYNATFHDYNKVLTEEQILEAAYAFWFADEDWNSDGKIWDYMSI